MKSKSQSALLLQAEPPHPVGLIPMLGQKPGPTLGQRAKRIFNLHGSNAITARKSSAHSILVSPSTLCHFQIPNDPPVPWKGLNTPQVITVL